MLSKKFYVASSVLISFLLTACVSNSSTLPVLARSDATYETTGIGSSKQKAQKEALQIAQKQCAYKKPVILSDHYTYNGVLDEKTGRMIEQGIGVVGAIFGTSSPKLSRNDDYEYTIKFRCE